VLNPGKLIRTDSVSLQMQNIFRSIVMLEDDCDVAASLSRRLQQSGRSVYRFVIDRAAISKAVQLKPDAILICIALSNTNCSELVAALRKRKELKNTRIGTISLLKPIDEETLLGALAGRTSETLSSGPVLPAPSEPALRVLLIEDHFGLAEAMAEFLRSTGLEVSIASSGNEALQLAAAFSPEIVLCDMNLPDMAGLDVLRAMRTNPATKDALLVIHTAMSEVEIRMFERIQRSEVNLFLSKPLTQEKLNRLLAELNAWRHHIPRHQISSAYGKPSNKTQMIQ
jgi:CheY-like chemotaxis protein